MVIKITRFYFKITILKENIFFKNIFNIYKILKMIFVLKKNKYKVSDVLYNDLKINLKKLVPNINFTNEIYMPISKERKKVDFGIEFKFRF